MSKYLDLNGLSYFWDKIKSGLLPSGGETGTVLAKTGSADHAVGWKSPTIPFGKVDSTSTSKVYTATVPGIVALEDGVACYLMNGVVTSESGFTININDLGAKPVYSTLAAATRATTLFNINYTLLLVYNSQRVSGGCWDAYYGYDSNTNTIGYQLRTNSLTFPATDKFYRYRLLFKNPDGTKFVPANTSTSTNATASRTPNTRPIDPFGDITYYGATAAVEANANPAASSLWSQYAFSLGYSFNTTGAALVLTYPKPVYLKCTPLSDGSATIDGYVQDLPNTEDGKIYIFLGVAYSATSIELTLYHPVYEYKNGDVHRIFSLEAALPTTGSVGDILTKTAGGAEWVTPASSAQQDNTRPITSAAVYTEIGNINALLATI